MNLWEEVEVALLAALEESEPRITVARRPIDGTRLQLRVTHGGQLCRAEGWDALGSIAEEVAGD